jgi:hypothetical protein
MKKNWFYEKNDYLLNHSVNKTFDEILRMSTDEFRTWCIELRQVIVYAWDELGIPPRVGYNENEIKSQFKKMGNFPVHEFWTIDEITGEKNVIRNTNITGNAVNQFFPSMMKTRINYTNDDSDGKSIYDFFAQDELLDRFITYATRHFKRDSFYHYSLPLKVMDKSMYGKLPVVDNYDDFYYSFINKCDKEYDYWLSPIEGNDYTGYNEEIKNQNFIIVTKDQLDAHVHNEGYSYNDLIINKELINPYRYSNMDYKGRTKFHIRVFKKGQKLFPIGLKAFRVSFCQYAVNFPPLTAKLLYDTFTTKGKDNIVWDPSSGWGGRLLGAMASKNKIHYIGNDPNTDHNTENGRTKYHEIYDFYRKNIKRGGLFEQEHNTFEFYQMGSEKLHQIPSFQKHYDCVDLVFTSPPYFAKEAYSDDPEQSYKMYGTWDIWVKDFLEPTLWTAFKCLRKDGHLLWNVADVKFGNDILPLEQKSIDICLSLGFQYIETIKMALAQSPGGNRLDENGKPRAKNFCKLSNGMFLKYEPILHFKK